MCFHFIEKGTDQPRVKEWDQLLKPTFRDQPAPNSMTLYVSIFLRPFHKATSATQISVAPSTPNLYRLRVGERNNTLSLRPFCLNPARCRRRSGRRATLPQAAQMLVLRCLHEVHPCTHRPAALAHRQPFRIAPPGQARGRTAPAIALRQGAAFHVAKSRA